MSTQLLVAIISAVVVLGLIAWGLCRIAKVSDRDLPLGDG